MTPTHEWLEEELPTAILMASTDDDVVFGRDASERCIMFRIGRYLAPAVEGCWAGRLWVDCEYNRIAGAVQEKDRQAGQGPGPCPGPSARSSPTSSSTIAAG